MNMSRWARWSTVLLLVGCNAKLSVEPGNEGGAGGSSAGHAGRAGAPACDGCAGAGGAGAGAPAGGAPGAAGDSNLAGESGGGAPPDQGGAFGTAGAEGGAPPGSIGVACIPGGSVSSGTGVATSELTTLTRCAPGLSCNANGKCAVMPACPQAAGECITRDVLGAGGAGGYSGNGGAQNVAGAAGSAGPYLGSLADESGVTALAVDDTNLYWAEYGTRDSLGNYQNDGSVMAMKRADGSTTKLASALSGPMALAVTSDRVYYFTDGAGLVGGPLHMKLARVALTGGTSETIQDGTPPLLPRARQTTATSGNSFYWSGFNAVYAISGASVTPTPVCDSSFDIAADATDLYAELDVISRVPLAGGAPQPLDLDYRAFTLDGDSIYGLEQVQSGLLLTKAAKTNGAWLRIRPLGEGVGERVRFAGDRYFVELRRAPHYDDFPGVLTGKLSTTTPPLQLIEPASVNVVSWAATADTFYWSDGRRIYQRAIPQ